MPRVRHPVVVGERYIFGRELVERIGIAGLKSGRECVLGVDYLLGQLVGRLSERPPRAREQQRARNEYTDGDYLHVDILLVMNVRPHRRPELLLFERGRRRHSHGS